MWQCHCRYYSAIKVNHKKKLDDKCKLVKANVAKEKQKAIANNGVELSSHTVLVEQNSIFLLFDISYDNEKYIFFFN